MNPDSCTAQVKTKNSVPLLTPIEAFIESLPLDRNNPVLCHDLYINGPTDCSKRKKLIKSFSNSIINNPPPPNTIFTFIHQEEGEKISDKEFKKLLKPIVKDYAKVSPALRISLDGNEIGDKSVFFLVKHMDKPHKTPEAFFLSLSNNNITIKAGEQLYQVLSNNPNLRCELTELLIKSDKLSEEERANKVAEKIVRLSNRNSNFYHLEKGVDAISQKLDELHCQPSAADYEEKCLQETRKLIEFKMEEYSAMLTQLTEEKKQVLSAKKGKEKRAAQQAINVQSDYVASIGSKIEGVESKIYRNFSTLPSPLIARDYPHSRILSTELFSTVNHETKLFQNDSSTQLTESKLGTLGREVIDKLDERLAAIKTERLINANKNNDSMRIRHYEASANATTRLEEGGRCAPFLEEDHRTNPFRASVGIACIFDKKENALEPLEDAKETTEGLFTQVQRVNPLGLFSIAAITAGTSAKNADEERSSPNRSRIKLNGA
jgi:hypothetical protein